MAESYTTEKIGTSKVLTIDDAKKRMKYIGDRAKEFEESIEEKQNQQFSDIMCVVFGYKLQDDGTKKLISKLPNGKILFPDKSTELKEIEPGTPYLCLVYEPEFNSKGEPAREAFAKLICEEYQPRIYVPSSRIPQMVWRESNGKTRHKAPFGNSYTERMMAALNEYENNLKVSAVKIVFRKNQRGG